MRTCSNCKGMMVVRGEEKKLYYFGMALTRYHLRLAHARRVLYAFEIIGILLLVILSFGFFAFGVFRLGIQDQLLTLSFWQDALYPSKALFFFGLLVVGAFIYRYMRKHGALTLVQHREYGAKNQEVETVLLDWKSAKHIHKKDKIDISKAFDQTARLTIEKAYAAADKLNSSQLQAEHIFNALLETIDIKSIFLRLGIPSKLLHARMAKAFVKNKGNRAPLPNDDVVQILFHAYEYAVDARQEQIRVTELLLATVGQSPFIQDVLYDVEVDKEKLYNVVEWVRIRHRLRRAYSSSLRAGSSRNKHGLDKAMTAIATPFLNNFSQDLTMAAMHGHLPPCVARDREIEEVFRIVESGTSSVVLVGDHGVGKLTMIEGIVERMIADDVPKRLQDKRFVQLSTSSLLAGTTVSGAQERLIRIMNEVRRSKNIILFINNVHDLMGVRGDETGLDISETLSQFLSRGRSLVFATTTPVGYNKYIVNSQLGKTLTKVEVSQMNINQAIQVLEAQAGRIEYNHNVYFSYDSLFAAADMAGKFLHDIRLPESALQVISEAASYVHQTKGEHHLVSRDDVAKIITDKTGILASSITEDESDKLLRLEAKMHERVVGQDAAVSSVANALRRARAEIRSTGKPIATFLFLGSTGVGKTELAKTIAEVYFGGEQRMIRVDMSEYQDNRGIYRLIGEPGQQGTGLLTEAVRQKPFSLILLDEIEKADPRILDLFLQVFDDGRLTDSVGRIIDFTNTIIIATSNAGTSFVQEGIRKGKSAEHIQDELLRGELKKHFRPEFLNRFDGITVFTPLNKEDIRHIAGLMLKRVAHDMLEKGITLKFTDEGLDLLSESGYDPEFGARPMRRAIQDMVENQLAELMLSGKVQRKDTIVFDGATGMRIERP